MAIDAPVVGSQVQGRGLGNYTSLHGHIAVRARSFVRRDLATLQLGRYSVSWIQQFVWRSSFARICLFVSAMSGNQGTQGSTQKDSADLFRRLRLEERLDRFEIAWQRGEQPNIEDYLSAADSRGKTSRRDELTELIIIDLEYRWQRAGQEQASRGSMSDTVKSGCLPDRPYLEDYAQQYQDLGPLEGLPMELIVAEFRVRQRWGQRPYHELYNHGHLMINYSVPTRSRQLLLATVVDRCLSHPLRFQRSPRRSST